MRVLLRLLATAPLVVVGLAVTAPSASALSCVEPARAVEDATSVFTGTVVDAEAHRVLVDVDEIWVGARVADRVWLATELDGWWDMFEGGSFPVGYSSTRTWLFAPHTTQHGKPVVNPCTAWNSTKPWGRTVPHGPVTRPVEQLVPAASPVVPLDRSQDGDGHDAWLISGSTAVALLVAGLGLGLVRRSRRTQSSG